MHVQNLRLELATGGPDVHWGQGVEAKYTVGRDVLYVQGDRVGIEDVGGLHLCASNAALKFEESCSNQSLGQPLVSSSTLSPPPPFPPLSYSTEWIYT